MTSIRRSPLVACRTTLLIVTRIIDILPRPQPRSRAYNRGQDSRSPPTHNTSATFRSGTGAALLPVNRRSAPLALLDSLWRHDAYPPSLCDLLYAPWPSNIKASTVLSSCQFATPRGPG